VDTLNVSEVVQPGETGSDAVRISVIVPTFNRAYCLAKAIDSILAQTNPLHEVIVIDDGSTDGTRELMAGYRNQVRYFWQENRGISAARNAGIARATGTHIAFLDSDDWWHPDKLRCQTEALFREPAAALAYTDYYQHHPDGSVEQYSLPAPGKLWPSLRYTNPLAVGSGLLFRKTVLIESGGFDETLRTAEDWDLMVRLRSRHAFVHVAEPLVHITISNSSLSTSPEITLEDAETVIAKTLVQDLSGWQRVFWKRRIRAVQLFHAGMGARVSNPARELYYLWAAVIEWPFPTFYRRRWKALAVSLLRKSRTMASGKG
jgi:cellulose synthase/poly-beta-1,6-N-acetylglucosamine synthase-like glycosyltransferase